MGETEILDLKDDVKEIKSDVKDLGTSVNSLRVLIAENYVTRPEFEKYKEAEKSSRQWWAGFIIAAAGVLMAIIAYFVPRG